MQWTEGVSRIPKMPLTHILRKSAGLGFDILVLICVTVLQEEDIGKRSRNPSFSQTGTGMGGSGGGGRGGRRSRTTSEGDAWTVVTSQQGGGRQPYQGRHSSGSQTAASVVTGTSGGGKGLSRCEH